MGQASLADIRGDRASLPHKKVLQEENKDSVNISSVDTVAVVVAEAVSAE